MTEGKDNKARSIELIEIVARAIFGLISLVLVVLSVGLIAYSAFQLGAIMLDPEGNLGVGLLDAVGYTVIAIAVFEVAKFLFEEEVLEPTETGHAREARRSITKFVSTITIAVFLEALVAIFQTSKGPDVSMMLYPTLLLLSGVALIVGLGAYQRLSASAERDVEQLPEISSEERTAKEKRDAKRSGVSATASPRPDKPAA
jgi:hypothetical protein